MSSKATSPVEDIRRLLAEHPRARGLAAPGMPMGSPGMEMGTTQRYPVLLIETMAARGYSPCTARTPEPVACQPPLSMDLPPPRLTIRNALKPLAPLDPCLGGIGPQPVRGDGGAERRSVG